MKKSILLVASVLLLAITSSKATHIVGGEFSVQWVSGNTFHVTLHFYRDCANGQADFDNPATMGIYDLLTNTNQQCLSVALTSRDTLKLGDACYVPDLCVELGTYEVDVVIPNNPDGYYISYSRCCRNGAVIVNLLNPADAGETWYASFPNPSLHNSTPVFGAYPKGYMCANNINVQDFSCTDADGDSLVYSLVTPLNGNTTSLDPVDNCPDPAPYPYVTWAGAGNDSVYIGGPMSINPQTGILTATPGLLGVYVYCVEVDEWSRGQNPVKLGEVRRDIQSAILTCTSAAAYPDTTVCAGNPIQIHATGGTSYAWSPTTGLSNPNIASPTATVFATTTYTVSVTNGSCVTTATVTVNVNSAITVSITPNGATTFCQGGSVGLAASGATKYTWSTGATTSSINASASGTYSVVGTSNGCSGSASIVVNVLPAPVVTITPNGPTSFCQGGTVKLTASGANSYIWNTGATTTAINVSSSGTYSVVGTTNECTGRASLPVTVNALPKVIITANGATTFCQGDSVTLTASGAVHYAWDNGSTSVSVTSKTNQSYYTVGTDANGCSAVSNTITVIVNRRPTPVITPNGPTSFCPGDSVGLCTSGGVSYNWTPNGQRTSCITAYTPGTYSVTVINANECAATTSIQVSVANAPVVTITGGPPSFCSGDSAVLTAHGANTYVWSPNGETTASINVKGSGSYYVTGSIGTCTGTSDPVLITVNPLPTVTIDPNGPTSFCIGGNVTITAATADNYLWNTGETTSSINVSSSGSYSVTGTDNTGCSAGSNVISIVVNPLPIVVATPDGPTSFCPGGSVNINGSGAVSYVWNPTNETTTGINVNTGGSYYTVGTDANGCTGTSNTVTVVVYPSPVVTIAPDGPTSFCPGGSVNLNGSGASTYVWNPTGSQTSGINVSTSGSYYTVGTDVNGCTGTSNVITVNVYTPPTVVATPDGPTTFCIGGSVNINGSGAVSYVWNPTNETTAGIHVSTAGSYYAVGTDANGCTGTSNTVTVIVNPLPIVVATPNGPTTFCQGGSVVITGSGASTYVWNPTNETTTGITVSTAGSFYTVGTDVNGCTGTSNVVTTTINPNPTVTIIPQGPTAICEGGSVGLCASNGTTFSWTHSADTTQCINAMNPGNYVVTITDANGCVGVSQPLDVTVALPPDLTANVSGPITCAVSSVSLTANSCTGSGITYVWLGPGSFSTTQQCTSATAAGTYTITATDICSTTTTVEVGSDLTPPNVTANGAAIPCFESSIQISANSTTPNATFSWVGPNGFVSALQDPTVTDSGTYIVTATDPSNGCTNTASAYVSKTPGQTSGVCGDQGSITSGFELDGNATTQTLNPPPDDWDLVYAGTSHSDYTTGIITDAPSNADNYFYKGSKDNQDVSGWSWNVQNVPDKDDLLHAGVAIYGHLLYFFGDRFATNGNSQMGFWLLQNNVQPQNNGTFSGSHAIGDLLILSDFQGSGGRSTPSIFAYEWVGSGGSDGTLNQLTLEEANSYAIVNATTVPSPWPYTPKFGPAGQFPPDAFFEGGIDLACLQGEVANSCFPSFLMESRSSSSVDAELKDFIYGSLMVNPNGGHRLAQAVESGKILRYAYPNPFSSVSTIEFEQATNTHTLVEVYTLTGEKIATLFDKDADAGVDYKVQFDGTNLAAGVYIYRITGGGQVTNGKLILMK